MSDLNHKTDRELLLLLCERMESLSATLRAHDKFINGNGEPGARIELDRIKQEHASQRLWLRLIGGGVIGVLISGVATAIVWLIRAMEHPRS